MKWLSIGLEHPKDGQRCLVKIWDEVYTAEYVVRKNGDGFFFPIYTAISTACPNEVGMRHRHPCTLGVFDDQPSFWAALEGV